ncbi:MAG: hypothetical protein ACYTGV_11290 [Planctomycetota bacterium]
MGHRVRHVLTAALLAVLATACASTNGPAEPETTGAGDSVPSGPRASESVKSETLAEAVAGYPIGERQIGGPTDVEIDLLTSFPKQDSLFGALLPKSYFKWKEDLYEKTGVELGISYQGTYQKASESRTDTDYASGGWLLFEIKWVAINKEQDYEGSLIASLDWRHTFGDAQPAFFGIFDVGSLWPTDFAFFDLDPAVSIFYWEQWFSKGRLVLRVGKQLAAQAYDFFRFKDARTSFTTSPLSAHTSIPHPAFGQAVSFKWWPKEGSELYVYGTLNDMNGDPERIGLDTFFEKHQFFYGLEIGYF